MSEMLRLGMRYGASVLLLLVPPKGTDKRGLSQRRGWTKGRLNGMESESLQSAVCQILAHDFQRHLLAFFNNRHGDQNGCACSKPSISLKNKIQVA